MDSPLQTVHLYLLKRLLGVKRTTPDWSVLRECGHEPLQFYWFRTAVRFCNALLRSNSITLSKVLRAGAESGWKKERKKDYACQVRPRALRK
eukprot:548897-Pelagomonas_calceolata.AAC.1